MKEHGRVDVTRQFGCCNQLPELTNARESLQAFVIRWHSAATAVNRCNHQKLLAV
jgi:hypothetical protein